MAEEAVGVLDACVLPEVGAARPPPCGKLAAAGANVDLPAAADNARAAEAEPAATDAGDEDAPSAAADAEEVPSAAADAEDAPSAAAGAAPDDLAGCVLPEGTRKTSPSPSKGMALIDSGTAASPEAEMSSTGDPLAAAPAGGGAASPAPSAASPNTPSAAANSPRGTLMPSLAIMFLV